MLVSIKHNEQTYSIAFKYADRVGRTRDGKRVNKTFATYPEFSLEQMEALYDVIKTDFISGVNYFEKIRVKASVNDTISQHFPRFLLHRKDEEDAELLAFETWQSQSQRYYNHLAKITTADGELFSSLRIRAFTRADIINLIKTDIKRYQSMEPEIRQAYAEGRVR